MINKLNPYDLPPEEERNVRIVLKSIEWDAADWINISLPSDMSIPVDRNLPEEEMISRALDAASDAWGYTIIDCDVEPIELDSVTIADGASLSDDTVDYTGEIF